jgi:hypothetical protein
LRNLYYPSFTLVCASGDERGQLERRGATFCAGRFSAIESQWRTVHFCLCRLFPKKTASNDTSNIRTSRCGRLRRSGDGHLYSFTETVRKLPSTASPPVCAESNIWCSRSGERTFDNQRELLSLAPGSPCARSVWRGHLDTVRMVNSGSRNGLDGFPASIRCNRSLGHVPIR